MKRLHKMTVEGRELTVYVPPSYRESEGRYPVAYIQDGGDQFAQCINYLDHLFAQGRLTELILVGITSHNRNDEYTPWLALPLVDSIPPFAGIGRAYVDEVADLIKPWIDQQYRTKREAEHTAIIGGSLGGLISLFAAYWRPETFGRIGLLSASFWYEGVMAYMKEHGDLAKEIHLFMSVGDCEGIYKHNAQKDMVQNTRNAYALLLEKGLPASQVRFVVEPEGTHDDLFMTKRFPEALQWLFPVQAEMRVEAYSIPGTEQWLMHAKRTGREYRILVAVPTTPPPEQGYPVLYSLDGNASFGSLAEAMRLQTRPPRGLPPAIIVSIAYDAVGPIVTDRRFYDYTVQADASELRQRPDGSPWPETGGAELFLSFIEEELKPAIERRFPIDRQQQALFGHSLGGFFALHVLFFQPAAFRYYIAGSPSVWWKGHHLLQRLPELEANLRGAETQADLLIAIGAEEKQSMVEDAERLYRMLAPYQELGLRVEHRSFEGEGHVSVIHPLISPMLRFILQK